MLVNRLFNDPGRLFADRIASSQESALRGQPRHAELLEEATQRALQEIVEGDLGRNPVGWHSKVFDWYVTTFALLSGLDESEPFINRSGPSLGQVLSPFDETPLAARSTQTSAERGVRESRSLSPDPRLIALAHEMSV